MAAWSVLRFSSILAVAVLLALFFAAGLTFQRFALDIHVLGLTIPTWCLILGSDIAAYPISHLISGIVSWLLRTSPFGQHAETLLLIRHCEWGFGLLLWSCCVAIIWSILDAYDPWKDERDADTFNNNNWWISRVVAINILTALLFLLRTFALHRISVMKRTQSYATPVRTALRYETVLRQLSAGIALRHILPHASRGGEMVDFAGSSLLLQAEEETPTTALTRGLPQLLRASLDGAARSTPSTRSASRAASPYSPHSSDPDADERLEEVQAVYAMDYLQHHPLMVGENVQITSAKAARAFGEALYASMEVDGAVPLSSLRARLHTARDVATMYALFGATPTTPSLTRDTVVMRCCDLYLERRKLMLSIHDLDSVVRALGGFLRGGVYLAILFVSYISFSVGPWANVAISISTTVLGLSFIFADTATQLFTSFAFLLYQHPFDVGDRVSVGTYPIMYVYRVELLTTTFRVWDGQVVTMANYVLNTQRIVNFTRAVSMYDTIEFAVAHETPPEQIELLQERIRSALRTRPAEFNADGTELRVLELQSLVAIRLGLFVAQRTSWHNAESYPRRHFVILLIKELCEELGIVYYSARQRILVQRTGPDGHVASHSRHGSEAASPPIDEGIRNAATGAAVGMPPPALLSL